MNPDKHLTLLAEARSRYDWAVANIVIALMCVALAGRAFMFGYVVAGLLIIVVSIALVVNADAHKKRGHILKEEAGSKRQR